MKTRYTTKSFYTKDKNNLLSSLAEKYKTDKGSIDEFSQAFHPWGFHTYTDFYSMLFDHCKDNIKNVFELGIGTNNEEYPSNMTSSGLPGASLRMWKEYFVNATIYGADIDKKVLFQEDSINTYYVDQTSLQDIKDMWNMINVDFDLIIDDGLHEYDANIIFYENSIHKLRDNGIYIIEDILDIDIEKYSRYFEKRDIPYNIVRLYGPNIPDENSLIILRRR